MPVGGRPRNQQLCFTVRPRLFSMRSFQSKPSSASGQSSSKRYKTRKSPGSYRYDQTNKSTMHDYTDFAYKEAVGKLKSMLSDTYTPSKYRHGKVDDSDDESGVSFMLSDTTRVARLGAYRKLPRPNLSPYSAEPQTAAAQPPEMLPFIERQEEYIEQLEKESQYCRDELSQLLGKVKDLINENETLHAQQRSAALQHSDPDEKRHDCHRYRADHTAMEGPSIVFESRISELEAQLTQARLDLKKAQEEATSSKRKLLDTDPNASSSEFYRQIDGLHREKRELTESLNKLQATIAAMRDKESDASRKAIRTQDVAEKAQLDRQQAEMEVQRLKSELDHQHQRLLDVLSEQTRKVAEERSQAERRYLQHVEQLNAELAVQRDSSAKLQLELDRHLRVEDDLRRDLAAKSHTAENIRKELNAKIASLQSELAAALSDRDSLEQELNTHKMSGERSERHNRQEASRLQLEVNALRQRIERNDAELIQARRENLRLAEQISMQESEISIYKARVGELDDEDGSKKASTVRELEGVVEKQAQAMKLLNQQCQNLTHTLEDTSAHHKQEMAELQNSIEFLTNRLESSLAQRSYPTEEYAHPTEHFQEHFEPKTSNYVTDEVSYQTDANYPARKENAEVLKALTPSEQYRDDKVSPVHVEKKPVLSRASSRGERSESPLVKQKSPLTRRESRAQIQSFSPENAYQIPEHVPEPDYEPPLDTYPEQPYYPEEPVQYSPAAEDYSAGVPYYPNQDAYRPPSRGAYQEPYQTETSRLRKSSSGESSTHMQQQSAYDPYYQQGSPDLQPVYSPSEQPVYAPQEQQPMYVQQDQQPIYAQQDQQPVYAQQDLQPAYAQQDQQPVPPDEGRKYQARSSRPPSTSEFEQKPIESGHDLVRQQSNVRRENIGKVAAPKNQRNTPTKFQ